MTRMYAVRYDNDCLVAVRGADGESSAQVELKPKLRPSACSPKIPKARTDDILLSSIKKPIPLILINEFHSL